MVSKQIVRVRGTVFCDFTLSVDYASKPDVSVKPDIAKGNKMKKFVRRARLPVFGALAILSLFAPLQATGRKAEAEQFSVNADRFDPYKAHKFRVKWDARYVPGISRVGPLRRTTSVVVHREGGDSSLSRRSPGVTEYAPIVLERGKTHDPEFEKWANKVWNHGSGLGKEVSLKDFRKDIIIEVYNEAGQLAMAYKVYRCWPSEYQALPQLNANGTRVAIERLTLQCEGWERDYEVGEPTEENFTEPAE